MRDTFEVTVYEGLVLDVPRSASIRFSERNPLEHNPLVGIKYDYHGWSDSHFNLAVNDPHPWLTCCVIRGCRANVDPDGPGICRACITDLRAQETP